MANQVHPTYLQLNKAHLFDTETSVFDNKFHKFIIYISFILKLYYFELYSLHVYIRNYRNIQCILIAITYIWILYCSPKDMQIYHINAVAIKQGKLTCLTQFKSMHVVRQNFGKF